MRIAVVLNPNSRKNRRAGVRAAQLRDVLGSAGEVYVTQSHAELTDVLEEVLTPELSCLVSVGGDGALHWALNAARPLAAARGMELPMMLPTNGGTIDFVARRAGVEGRAESLLPRLMKALERGPLEATVLDSLEVRIHEGQGDGPARDVLGFAMAAAGIGQRFFDEYYEADDPGPLTIVSIMAKGVASLGAGLLPGPLGRRGGRNARRLFRPFEARVTIDGVEVKDTAHGAVHAGAFDVNLGGVVRVFPLAKAPGAMHVQAGAISPAEMVRALPALLAGGAIPSKTLRDTNGTRMDVEALGEPLRPVIDGEMYQDVRRLSVALGPRVRIARV